MSDVRTEIQELENRLRLAELGPDPEFFEAVLADDVVFVPNEGPAPKSKVVEAHRPGKAPKFTHVEMSDMKIVEHGNAAVVTCRGMYEGPGVKVTLTFMRVWLKTHDRWQIIAGSIF